jgi:DNA-directed RNA polymerase specialized sigma54-like protein
MAELTSPQEEYFRILASLDSNGELHETIEDAKEDLRNSNDRVVRGLTRVKGFTPNE